MRAPALDEKELYTRCHHASAISCRLSLPCPRDRARPNSSLAFFDPPLDLRLKHPTGFRVKLFWSHLCRVGLNALLEKRGIGRLFGRWIDAATVPRDQRLRGNEGFLPISFALPEEFSRSLFICSLGRLSVVHPHTASLPHPTLHPLGLPSTSSADPGTPRRGTHGSSPQGPKKHAIGY